jgi:pentatricopeptide repeat protein
MALSSPSKFEAFYLNICSKTMHEFKRVGRVRTAILVGRDLAKFHCRRGNFDKAEELLLELLELFQSDKWSHLGKSLLIVNENRDQINIFLFRS